MTRFLAILAALTCAASAQTYRTVTADTNNVIRTNFTLGSGQISGAFAISNVTGLQSALDGKLVTNGDAFALTNFPALLLRTNGSAAALTNFPALVLTTNSAASEFPATLLRTNGDGGGLTNLPNANLSNATGVLPLLNGGTGATNASAARSALELGTASTNAATAFQTANTNLTALASGDGSSLTNVTITDASSLTNFPADLLRTNGSAGALTNFPSELLRTNGDGSGLTNISVDLTAVLPSYAGNSGKVLAVASGETNVEWTAISNTVTDASTLTNFPAIILQTNSAEGSFPAFLLRTNGSAADLTSFPASLLTTNGSASGLTNFPTFNQNTTGTASNVTGVVAISNGGSGQTTAAAAIEAFLPAYSGNANQILALNSNANGLVWTLSSGGIVNLADTTNGVTNVLTVENGGTGGTNRTNALISLGVFSNLSVFLDYNRPSTWTNAESSVVIGSSNSVLANADSMVNIGYRTTNQQGFTISVGRFANTRRQGDIAIGDTSHAEAATLTSFFSATALGYSSYAKGDHAVSLGSFARASNNYSVQLSIGTNTISNSIQFLSAGSVTTNLWAALANAGTVGTNLLRSTNITNAQAAIFTATTTNAPTNTNAPTPDAWLDVRVGTNDYKLPLWQ